MTDNFVARRIVNLRAHALIPLREAWICAECETVHDGKGDICPACRFVGGQMALRKLLGEGERTSRIWVYPDEAVPGEGEPQRDTRTRYSVEQDRGEG